MNRNDDPHRGPIYTIGHSNHALDDFVHLLAKHSIEAVADVRSQPYSRWNPQFNREALRRELRTHGIDYVFLGRELGARVDDPSCYDGKGRVVYGRIAGTALFKSGVERLERGHRDMTVALVCAERDPVDCHRAILVARVLEEERGVEVVHILADGSCERHAETMRRLARLLDLTQGELFEPGMDLEADAYAEQERRIAHRRGSHDGEALEMQR